MTIKLLTGLALVLLFRNPPDVVIHHLFQTVVGCNQSRNFLEENGVYIIPIGTGAPLSDENRTGAQTVLVADQQVVVFDISPESRLKLELSPADAGAV